MAEYLPGLVPRVVRPHVSQHCCREQTCQSLPAYCTPSLSSCWTLLRPARSNLAQLPRPPTLPDAWLPSYHLPSGRSLDMDRLSKERAEWRNNSKISTGQRLTVQPRTLACSKEPLLRWRRLSLLSTTAMGLSFRADHLDQRSRLLALQFQLVLLCDALVRPDSCQVPPFRLTQAKEVQCGLCGLQRFSECLLGLIGLA